MEQVRRTVHGWLAAGLAPLASRLRSAGIGADHVTVAGFALAAAAAGLAAAGWLAAAGVLYLIAGLADLLDGVLARSSGAATRFGAFLDSTLDRASEGLMFAALAWLLASRGEAAAAGAAALALLGSLLVSYARARAEALGADCRDGVATRAERVVLVSAGLVAALPAETAWAVALLTAATAAQRIVRARAVLGDGER